jgi:peroxiredoxin
VLAVGPQSSEDGKAMGLPFPVLSDPELEAAKKYGLLHEKGRFGKDVPRPTTILIGEDRSIRWIRAADNIRIRPTVDEVIEQLRR